MPCLLVRDRFWSERAQRVRGQEEEVRHCERGYSRSGATSARLKEVDLGVVVGVVSEREMVSANQERKISEYEGGVRCFGTVRGVGEGEGT
jgi:hypothetical protein